MPTGFSEIKPNLLPSSPPVYPPLCIADCSQSPAKSPAKSPARQIPASASLLSGVDISVIRRRHLPLSGVDISHSPASITLIPLSGRRRIPSPEENTSPLCIVDCYLKNGKEDPRRRTLKKTHPLPGRLRSLQRRLLPFSGKEDPRQSASSVVLGEASVVFPYFPPTRSFFPPPPVYPLFAFLSTESFLCFCSLSPLPLPSTNSDVVDEDAADAILSTACSTFPYRQACSKEAASTAPSFLCPDRKHSDLLVCAKKAQLGGPMVRVKRLKVSGIFYRQGQGA